MRHSNAAVALASACLLALGACSGEPADEGADDGSEEVSSSTIAALIAEDGDLSTVEELMEYAGLNTAFDGTAAYTVFAPTDSALASLGEDFSGEEARPALLAILREHIVPGYLTDEDIAAAIEAQGGPVQMQTMGNTMLTFSADGDAVTVSTAQGGASARVTEGMRGANGVVVPIDTVLKDFEPA